MASVTAVKMDCVTEKSGHNVTGMAVSVCITPAAPSPLPIPYPTMAMSIEGITDPPMRTKINGAKIMTVGSVAKCCHGNEPGTLKETLSLNTGGPCFPYLGAPIVICELGMMGITGSLGQMNKAITVGAGATASGAGGGAGGGGGGSGGGAGPSGQSSQAPSNSGGGGGGGNEGAGPPSPPAPPGADGQASAGHPVDVATGALYTNPTVDFQLPGFLHLKFTRSYSSARVRRNTGMGYGWTHDLDWRATRVGDALDICTPNGQSYRVRMPEPEEILLLPFGMRVTRLADNLLVESGDGLHRVLGPAGDGQYLLAQVRDAFGNTVELGWEAGILVWILDSVGREAKLLQQGPYARWEVSVQDGDGKTHVHRGVTYETNDRGDLVGVIDAGGAEVRYSYDDEHYLVREELPDGLVYHFVYAISGDQKRCVETWGELAGHDVFAELGCPAPPGCKGIYHSRLDYRPGERTTTVMDALGQRHIYQCNPLGLVELYTDPRGYTSRYEYDELGSLLSIRDAGGRVTRFSLDGAGRRSGVRTPDGAFRSRRRDEESGWTEHIRPDGKRIRRRYDKNKLVEQVDVEGRSTTLTWNERGRLVEGNAPQGTYSYEYDAHGNIKRAVQPSGATTEYEFDLFGCPVTIRTRHGLEYHFEYDSRHDLVRLTDNAGSVTEIGLDARGDVIEHEEGGRLSTFRRVAGVVVEAVRPDGLRWRFGHDALLRLRWIENPAGERYAREYDGIGNIARETSFGGITTSYERDGSGFIVRTTRSDGSWARFELDGEGRILKAEHSDGLLEHFQYDAMGGVVRARNAHAAVLLERNAYGRVEREVLETGGFCFAVERSFDALGQVTSRRYSSGWSVEYERRPEDGTMTALRVAAKESEMLAFERNVAGAELRRSTAKHAVAFERDARALPVRIQVTDDEDAVLRERSYRWDPIGPVAEIGDNRYGGRQYELDPEGRPLAAIGLGSSDRFVIAPQGTPVPAEKRWSLGRDGRPLATHDETLEWDARGRLVRREGGAESWQYEWDDKNRLVAAKRGDGVALRYLYDPLGRCIAQLRGDGISTWFGWDGDTIVEEQPSNSASTQRVFDDDQYSPLVEGRDGRDWRMCVTDATGTPWLFLHADGRESELELGPWGKVVRSNGDPGQLRFAGQRADAVTGLSYQRHRWYDPRLHVFLTPDVMSVLVAPHEVGFVPNTTFYIDPLGLLIIITGDTDAAVTESAGILSRTNNNARVVPVSDLPGDPPILANEDHVMVVTHGSPGQLNWGAGNKANGQTVGEALTNAGFRGGSGGRVDLVACNGATPPQGGGPSAAQGIANVTGSPVGAALSNNPQETYDRTQHPIPGSTTGQTARPGVMWVEDSGSTHVHHGTWETVRPRGEGTAIGTRGRIGTEL